jgi:tetratricopeptide (TPR) repeat protein
MMFALIGLTPHDYSPTRFSLLLIPAIIIACFSIWDETLRQRKISSVTPGWAGTGLLSVLMWFTLYPVIGNIFFLNVMPGSWFTWAMLFAGIALGLAIRLILSRWRQQVLPRTGIVLLIVVLLLSAIANGFRYRRLNVLERNYTIKEAADDVAHIVGENAVLSGPYADALTIDNTVRSFVYLFGMVEIDTTLFDRYPITHVAVDKSNLDEALKVYPRIRNASVVTRYWIRDYEVMLIRINDIFGNERANEYEESYYEKAAFHARQNRLDSALYMLNAHLTRHPMTKSAGKLMGEVMLALNRYEEGIRIWRRLAEMYPTDFHIQMRAGEVFLSLGLANNNRALTIEGNRLLARGALVNRYKANQANRIVADLIEQYRQAPPASP